MELEYESEGLEITVKDDIITQIVSGVRTVSVGERVRSRGSMYLRSGRFGTVTALYDPHKENSSGIIDVLWDGDSYSKRMEFRDLIWILSWVM